MKVDMARKYKLQVKDETGTKYIGSDTKPVVVNKITGVETTITYMITQDTDMYLVKQVCSSVVKGRFSEAYKYIPKFININNELYSYKIGKITLEEVYI